MINYHVHTSLCRHATGTIDEYIRAAADAGLHEIGFSDHAPIPLPMREGITMEPGEVESYIALVLASKENTDSIDVPGLRVDYPLFGTFDDKYFLIHIDFITGSCHYRIMGLRPSRESANSKTENMTFTPNTIRY